MVGFGVLAGLRPFHTWSPDGHVAAPTAVSMLHAGVLMKLGAFGILRVGMSLFPEGAEFWAPVLMTLGVTGALYGAISAMAQRDLKYMIGYSSVSHMGFVLMGLATMSTIGINGAVLQMFAHGVMTALMFAMVGGLYDQAHVRDMSVFGGLSKNMPRLTGFFAVAGLSSLGLPGLAGFIAEFHIFVGAFKSGYPWAGALGIVAAAITATYILRMLGMAFFGPFNERWAGLREMRLGEQFGGAHIGLAARDGVEIHLDSQPGSGDRFGQSTGQTGGTEVLNPGDQALLVHLQAGLDELFFLKGVADLHRGPLGLRFHVEGGRSKDGCSTDPITTGRRAQQHGHVAGPAGRSEHQLVRPEDAQAHDVDQGISAVAVLEGQLSAHRWHPNCVPVAGHSTHHPFQEVPVAGPVERAKAKRIPQRDGAGAHRENVTHDAPHAGGGPLIWLHQ